MRRPPVDPRSRPRPQHPAGRAILVSWAMMAAVLLLVWTASNPVLGAALLAGGGGLFVVGRRARRLVRCARERQQLTVSLGRHGHVTVSRSRCCPSG